MSSSDLTFDSRPQPSQLYRWLVLIFVSLAMFGNYYVYDSINPLERIFLEQLGFSASMFGWLNASYSVAALLTLLIGGILIDRFGIKKSLMLFSILILLGRNSDGVSRKLLHDGCRPYPGRSGRRIADRRRHHRAGPMVQGQENSASPSAST